MSQTSNGSCSTKALTCKTNAPVLIYAGSGRVKFSAVVDVVYECVVGIGLVNINRVTRIPVKNNRTSSNIRGLK